MRKQCELFGPECAPAAAEPPTSVVVPEPSRAPQAAPPRRTPLVADALCFDPELAQLEQLVDVFRPARRRDCEAAPRPCPWVSCRYHLFREREDEFGALVESELPIDAWGDTCTLDVAAAVEWRRMSDRRKPGDARMVPFVQLRRPAKLVERGALREWEPAPEPTRALEVDNVLVGELLGISREQVRVDRHRAREQLLDRPALLDLLDHEDDPP